VPIRIEPETWSLTLSTRSRRRFDDDDYPVTTHGSNRHPDRRLDDEAGTDQPAFSNYADSAHGPSPTPDWVVASARAIDLDLGVLKSGKEAEVSLLARADDNKRALMAVKRYRGAQHRLFHRDAGYLEGQQLQGRNIRRSRELRAMRTRTEFGRELIAGQWAAAEFAVLSRLWQIGAAVPYPVQLVGTELMMEFIGDATGAAAPRLAQLRPDRRHAEHLFAQLRDVLLIVAEAGYAHADLSPYNILVDDTGQEARLVLIDVPQAIDLVGNPHGFEYLRRDCVNVCTWFEARGVHADVDDLYSTLAGTIPHA
jgi:RIO kinase 1